MRVLPSVVVGLMLSCGAMQAAHAADCSTKKENLSIAEVSKISGVTIATAQEAGPSCMYSSAADKSGMATQIQLARMEGGSKQAFDAMTQAMTQNKMTCDKVSGIGDDARLCGMPASPMQSTVFALKGTQLYTAVIVSPAAMSDKAVAGKLPDATKALATALVAK
jgi:hypothetical protein